MSNFENYDFILHDGVVIENEKADKEGRKKRMSAMCVKVREQTNMNRKEFAEWLGIPYRTMQDSGDSHTNVLFDLVFPAGYTGDKDARLAEMCNFVKEQDPRYCCMVKVEQSYASALPEEDQ